MLVNSNTNSRGTRCGYTGSYFYSIIRCFR